MCKNIISGKYGELYDGLNTAKLLGFFRKFDQDNTDFFVEENIKKSNELKVSLGDDAREFSSNNKDKEARLKYLFEKESKKK